MTLDEAIKAHAGRYGTAPALISCGRAGTEALTWPDLDARTAPSPDVDQSRCAVVTLTRHDLTDVVPLVAALRAEQPVLVLGGRQPAPMREALLAEVRRSASAIEPGCVLLASGGTTGRPKLVVDRSIRALAARPNVLRPFLHTGWRAGQRQLLCSPLYHAAGLTPFVEGLITGNRTYLPTAFDPVRLGDLVDMFGIEWLQMTPFHMGQVLAGPRGPATWRTRPRLVHMADHCPARVKRAYHAALGPQQVYELYAASEGLGLTMARGDEWDARPGTVGRGFRTALRIADEDGRPLPPNRTGEVYLRSGARRAGAYLSHAGRLRVDPDGFATLGDVGHLDEDGYLFLRPRQVVTIAVAGVTVNPAEVEAELLEHPDVADAGVCGQPSAELGERVVAVIVPARPGLTAQTLGRWARARLSAAQVPARYVFTPALPRADTGKLDRRQLLTLVLEKGGMSDVAVGGPR
jgi:bile acid-coenzyme A ligase